MTRAGFVLETQSATETDALGRALGLVAPAGTFIALRGELGAGKTALTRGIAAGLFGPEAPGVTSPTYVLQHVHRGTAVQQRPSAVLPLKPVSTESTGSAATLYHLDVYRLGGPQGSGDGSAEFEGAGLGEALRDPRGWVCVEWPERIEALLPADRLEIEFEHLGEDTRAIHVLATGPESGKTVDALIPLAGSRELLLAFLAQYYPPHAS